MILMSASRVKQFRCNRCGQPATDDGDTWVVCLSGRLTFHVSCAQALSRDIDEDLAGLVGAIVVEPEISKPGPRNPAT